MDDPGAWRASVFANTRSQTPEPVAAQSCAGCHMRAESTLFEDVSAKDGKLRSHRFAGSHTPFAAGLGDARQLAAMRDNLEHSIVLNVPVVFYNGQAMSSAALRDPQPGSQMACDKRVRNCLRDRDPVVKIDLTPTAALLTSSVH